MPSSATPPTTARTVFITGTSRGIGRFLTLRYLEQGSRVYGCSRSPSDIEHPNYVHLVVDLCDSSDTESMLSEFRRIEKRLDILINNAGIASMGPAALQPPSVSKKLMDLNFNSVVQVTHGVLRLLRKSTEPRIVNVTSVAVPFRLEGEAVYSATKAAIEQWTRVLAKEVGPFGITVNAVGPTPIDTDLIRGVPKDKIAALIARQSIPKWATLEDVAHVVDFFIDPKSTMITGQVLYLAGAG